MTDIIASDKPVVEHVVASWPMYRSMVGLGLVCSCLLAVVYILTLPIVQKNQALYLQQAVLMVLPGARQQQAFVVDAAGGVQAYDDVGGSNIVYAGYDDGGELVGLALVAEGRGYQDTIRLIFGYDPRSQQVIGMRVLASKETPGLGDKIETEEHFLKNFEALDVTLDGLTGRLRHSVVAVKQGQKTEPWQVDGITGATISSKAIASIMNTGSQHWLPVVRKELTAFRSAGSQHFILPSENTGDTDEQ